MKETTSKCFFAEFDDRTVLINSNVDKVSHFISLLFKDLLHTNLKTDTEDNTALETYSVQLTDDVISVFKEGVSIASFTSEIEAANYLMNVVKFDLLSPISQSLALHASLVSYEGKSILLPGNSGNGKSLTTLGLVSLGCEYHTDEVVLLNSSDNKITPFVRPLMVKSHGLDAVKSLINKPLDDFLIQGESISSIPVDSMHGHFQTKLAINYSNGLYSLHTPPPIQAIVFPKYDASSQGVVQKLSSAQTLMKLFENNVVGRNLKGHGMPQLTKLAQNTIGIQLDYAGYPQLPDLFKNIQTLINQ